MAYQTFAHPIKKVKTLLDGLQSYGDELAKWGVSAEVISQLNENYTQANLNEQKRNELKASSREASSAQEQTMNDSKKQYGMIKKLVRIALPEEAWPAFGFRAGEYAKKESQPATDTQG